LFSYLADNFYQEFSSHGNEFSIDLSNPIHIEVNTGVKDIVNVVLDKGNDQSWKFPKALG
jgi:hypothetical protein